MQNSSIEWTDHTFNPWWGCQRVSPGCEHCYAEVLAHRYNFKVWGPAKTTGRREMSENYWRQPLKWNATAQVAGKRARVFCASMADVFEEHPGVVDARARLFNLIDQTPSLDWLLLTKRPQNIMPMMADWLSFPQNIWIGTSCEDQQRADERIPHLLKVPARVRFLSCEPLLGPINLQNLWQATPCWRCGNDDGEAGRCFCGVQTPAEIHWVIVGGESGHGARPMAPEWARSLRNQCEEAGAAFFFKQWGQWLPFVCERDEEMVGHFVGADGRSLYIADLLAHVHEIRNDRGYVRMGKHAAGRMLDGRTWDQFPA